MPASPYSFLMAQKQAIQNWVGRQVTIEDVVDPRSVAQMDALLGGEGAWPAQGETLPPLWHWMYFAPRAPQHKIGEDGHTAKGEFMPPIPLPLRMFAGAEVTFHQPFKVGQRITCTTTIADIKDKTGRVGEMAFVTLQDDIMADDVPACSQSRTYVYRNKSKIGGKTLKPAPLPGAYDWIETIVPDPVMLFRFSALTFNAHRIHYDHPYATSVEGYPGLIVHGPLIGLFLAWSCVRACPDQQIGRFSFQLHAPLYEGEPFSISGKVNEEGAGAHLWAANANGDLTSTGEIEFTSSGK